MQVKLCPVIIVENDSYGLKMNHNPINFNLHSSDWNINSSQDHIFVVVDSKYVIWSSPWFQNVEAEKGTVLIHSPSLQFLQPPPPHTLSSLVWIKSKLKRVEKSKLACPSLSSFSFDCYLSTALCQSIFYQSILWIRFVLLITHSPMALWFGAGPSPKQGQQEIRQDWLTGNMEIFIFQHLL